MYSPKLRRIQKTGTEFRFSGDAEDIPEPSSGSRETPKTYRNRVPVPGSCQKQTGTGFRFPQAAEDKPEPSSGSRETPKTYRNRVPVPGRRRRHTGTGFRFPRAAEDKPEPSSGSRELPKINRNRVPVLLLCRNRVYISSFFLSPRRSALVICFSHVFSVSQRRKSRSGSSSCTLSHASSAS